MKAIKDNWQFWALIVTISVLALTQARNNGVQAATLQRVVEDQAMAETYTRKLVEELSRLNGNVEHTNGYLEALGMSIGKKP